MKRGRTLEQEWRNIYNIHNGFSIESIESKILNQRIL